ncbi:MAG: SocA family protein [Chloroflexi bacterium]|nr:SocA family protein [Chloroflexota bacterium]
MLTASDVARYFLASQDDDCGELITNLKLQKLCYYAQGFSLAIRNEPLFADRIEAWKHGPVIPSLWQEYRDYEYRPIDVPEDVDFDLYNQDTKDLLDEVYNVYGQFSAWKLRDMSHEEPPWREANGGEISIESMKKYFKTLLN